MRVLRITTFARAYAILIGNWDGRLVETTYQMSERKTLAISISMRDNRITRDRNCSTTGVVAAVRFTAGHKTQTVFGAPGDARVCHSVSRHTLFLKSSPSFAHLPGHYPNLSYLHSPK